MNRVRTCAVLFSLLVFSAIASAADPWIYWVRKGELGRLSLDGQHLESLISGSATPTSAAIDPVEGFVYWTDLDTDLITKTRLDGSESIELARQPRGSRAIQLAGEWVYFGAVDDVHRMRRDGSGYERVLEVERPADLLVVGERLVWLEYGSSAFFTAELDGSGRAELFRVEGALPRHIAAQGDRLLWLDDTERTLWSASYDGSSLRVEHRTTERRRLRALAADDSSIYVTVDDGPRIDPRIYRLSAEGELVSLPLEVSYPSFILEVADGQLYWSELRDGSVMLSPPTGGKPRIVVEQRINQPVAVVAARGWIYWLERKPLGGAHTRVLRCRPDGSEIETFVELPASSNPVDMVVFDNHLVILVGQRGADEIWAQQLGAGERFRLDVGPDVGLDGGGENRIVDLLVKDDELHWLNQKAEVWRFDLRGAPPKRVRRLPPKTKEHSRFASTDKPLRHRSLVAGPPDYFIDLTRDALFKLEGRRLKLVAEDLYLSSLERYAGKIYWSGTKAIGTVDAAGAVETLYPVWHTKDLVIVDVARLPSSSP